MSDIHVCGWPEVRVRCQFKNIPGVSHITIKYDPTTHGDQITVRVECFGLDFTLFDSEIYVADAHIKDSKHYALEGRLAMFTPDIGYEIAKAISEGMKTLSKMIKAAGHDKNFV